MCTPRKRSQMPKSRSTRVVKKNKPKHLIAWLVDHVSAGRFNPRLGRREYNPPPYTPPSRSTPLKPIQPAVELTRPQLTPPPPPPPPPPAP